MKWIKWFYMDDLWPEAEQTAKPAPKVLDAVRRWRSWRQSAGSSNRDVAEQATPDRDGDVDRV